MKTVQTLTRLAVDVQTTKRQLIATKTKAQNDEDDSGDVDDVDRSAIHQQSVYRS